MRAGSDFKSVEKDSELHFCAKVMREFTCNQVLCSLVFARDHNGSISGGTDRSVAEEFAVYG